MSVGDKCVGDISVGDKSVGDMSSFVDFRMNQSFQRIILLNIVQFAVRISCFSLAVSAELMMLFSLMIMISMGCSKTTKSMLLTDVGECILVTSLRYW